MKERKREREREREREERERDRKGERGSNKKIILPQGPLKQQL